jgi:NAD-dependent SIR2 family protein deacetylase
MLRQYLSVVPPEPAYLANIVVSPASLELAMSPTSSTPTPLVDPNDLFHARRWIKEAESIIVTAGVGMCIDSGLPNFRGDEDLWDAYPALRRAGVSFTDITNGEAFGKEPELSWGFYGHLLALYRKAEPHAGFEMLRELGWSKTHGMFIFTSNVDGQFQKAGVAGNRIVECHGSAHSLQCSVDCMGLVWPADKLTPVVDMADCRLRSPLPRCPECGAVARPNILMFNDYRWNDNRIDVQYGRLRRWLGTATRAVVIELGAGKSVPAVRRMSESLDVPLVRINSREWQVSGSDQIGLRCGALEGLTLLLE